MSEKIVILGVTGFIGGSVAAELAATGRRVAGLSRNPPAASLAGVDYIIGSIENVSDFDRLLKGARVVIAASGSLFPASVEGAIESHVRSYLLPMLRLAEECDRRGIRIVHASSGGTVYGAPTRLPVRESDATVPLSQYGSLMRAAEVFLRCFRRAGNVSLRLANVYGPGQPVRENFGLIPAIFSCAREGRRFTIWGDGSMIRDFIYIRDAVRAFILAIDTPEVSGAYNIGSGTGTSVNEVVRAVERVTGRRIEVRRVAHADPYHVNAIVLDCSAAERDLGWRHEIGLAEGLGLTFRTQETHELAGT
jgi:UDP-glucose 4-epimerase